MKSVLKRFEQKPVRILGLMSGTSLDGLDIALVRWNSDEISDFTLEAYQTIPYDEELRQKVRASLTGIAEDVCAVNFALGRDWSTKIADFLEQQNLHSENITCIGSHGQTIWHISGDSTLQMGEPAVMATQMGIPVVSNFRENDIAVGGTGAPLIPFLDWLLYRNLPGNTIALNIGGIANITCLTQGCDQAGVVGWDTGPGNMVVDRLVEFLSSYEFSFDKNGEMAFDGVVNDELLARLMRDEYVNDPPPKSTGREYYSDEYIRSQFPLIENLSEPQKNSLVATASEWTVRAIVENVRRFWKSPDDIDRVIVGGGGVHNRYFMERLASHFSNADILSCVDYGIPVDAKEAIGFALFAYAFLSEIPANLPKVTGANRPVIMGKLTV